MTGYTKLGTGSQEEYRGRKRRKKTCTLGREKIKTGIKSRHEKRVRVKVADSTKKRHGVKMQS